MSVKDRLKLCSELGLICFFLGRRLKNLKENVIGTELGKVVAPKGKLLKVQYVYVCILFALKFGVKQVNKAQTLNR